jgi:hypothetical protein
MLRSSIHPPNSHEDFERKLVLKQPLKIISGGQTGVDRAALEWAVANSVPHGGWCPKGRKAEDGVIPMQFDLEETRSSNYLVRTRRNVRESDGTVIFSRGKALKGGTAETARFARAEGKPLLRLVSSLGVKEASARLGEFLEGHRVAVLNVAGPRATEERGVGRFVKAVLSGTLGRALRKSR